MDNYEKHIDTILSIFEKRFTQTYQSLEVRKRARLLPYTATLYRRWYFSALIEETPLSPANIVESVNREHGRGEAAFPLLRIKSLKKYSGFDKTVWDMDGNGHPVLQDLRVLVDYCDPSVDLTEDDGLLDGQVIDLSARLSLGDPHYASYLLELALWMNLVVKLPSIYANRAQIAKDAKARLAADEAELFRQVVDTSIRMTASVLSELIELPEPVFTESFIRAILARPVDTDDIFSCVYETIGFSLEDIFDSGEDEELDEMDAALLSGTFMMGVLLDKYFYTPFSYYLQLIRPLYVRPFDFEKELTYFIEFYDSDDEVAAAFFAPCSRYTLTRLGLDFFAVAPGPGNFMDTEMVLPFSMLEERLFSKPEVVDYLPIWINHVGCPYTQAADESDVYALKIKAEADAGLWLCLDIPEGCSLRRLYEETAARFGLQRNETYSFFHDEVESPFTEYASHKRGRRAHKTTDIALSALDFTHKTSMILTVYNQTAPFPADKKPPGGAVKFTIEVQKKKPRDPGRAYPCTTRVSKGMKKMAE